MLKRYRITSILVCISMLFCLIVSTSALGLTQVFSGKVVSGDNIDLSDIEIEIYSSAPKYDETGNFLYYVETYERSVYADADGDFEFVKPSLYCSYTISVETLPANYGISKHTQFIIPTRTNDSVILSAIATAEADYSGGSFYAVFRAADGTEVYTDYDIVEDSESSVLKETGKLDTSKNFKDINSYTLSGTIVTNGRNYRYSKSFDISDYSEIEKADLLCSLGKITEEEKSDIYLQNGELLYEHNCVQVMNGEGRAVNEAAIEYDSTYDIGFGSYTMQIRYNANDFTNNLSNLNAFKSQLTNIYRYFCITNGFASPTSSGNYLYLYITPIEQALGRTRAYTGGRSDILIHTPIVQNGTAERTLAHEFMHAIMIKYLTVGADLWFNESFATMASLIYSNYSNPNYLNSSAGFSEFRGYLEDFVGTPNLSLTSDTATREYGAFVFPLCIYQNHGGWSTIKNIFENYDNTSPEFESIYGTYNGQRFDFDAIFDEMSIAILFPTNQNLGFEIARDYYIQDLWPAVQCSQQNYIPSFITNNSIAPLSNHYFSYSYTENIGTVYITAESTGNCLFNLFTRINSSSSIEHTKSDETRIVYQIDNFGLNNSNNKFILMVTNFSVSSTKAFTISVTR